MSPVLLSIAVIALTALSGFLFYASYSISSGIYVKAFCKANTPRKVVALTFDDGPDPNTPAVLDVLARHHALAAFFCIGRKAAEFPDLVKRMVSEGHLVGNHSYCHGGTFPLFSPQRIASDLRLCNDTLTEITHAPINYFRPPFGVTNPLISKALRQFHFEVIGWSIRSYDTMGAEPQKVARRIIRQLRPGSVILLHDRLPHTPEVLELLFDEFTKSGYQVIRIDQMEKEI